MKGWKDKAKPWLNVLPTGVLAACIGISLSGYEAPVYEVKAAQDTNEESTTEEPTGEVTLDLDNMEITLPPTTSHSGPASGASKTVGKAPEVSGYKDGTYYGTGTGFGGKIRVKVVVKDGKITDITVVESQDGAEYMRAASALLKNIIKTQSTNVDTVSGATYSSAGLIEAVRDALKDAGLTEKNDKKDTKKKDKKDKKTEDTDNTETNQNVTYKDGTYYGTGTGFGGPLKVKVVVTDGKITDIQVIESADDQEYIKAASALLKDIIRTQSTNVDTVSGATYSSKGLIEAVKDALKDAVSTMETEDSKPADTTEQTNPDNTEQNNQSGAIPEGKVPYKDGVYYGTGEGYKGDITVAVTISDHTIRYILVTETSDDEAFFARAKAVLQAIMQQQSTDVDAVSGATFSSKGLIEAVQEALNAAKKATEGGNDRTDSEVSGQDGNA
ncbi:MAG: FMN-binding protein, partial [Lachnospiraceae bacterium]|nr:FMN-binding protein [Lachnospiraceae bacterium]